MKFVQALLVVLCTVYTAVAYAIPSLQLSGGGSAGWVFDNTTNTWVFDDETTTSFNLYAYANATKSDGGNGDYAWDTGGTKDPNQYAYLIVGATPDVGVSDAFDISITGASFLTSGWGTPPLEDSNSLPSHGIYSTYFEIYEFQFDGSIVNISDQQPGETGTGKGYEEILGIDVNSVLEGVKGLHFDLFTVSGDTYNTTVAGKKFVYNSAPYSHDAEYKVPEPGIPALMGIGLLGISLRRFVKSRNL